MADATQSAKADVSQTIPDDAIEAARWEIWRFDEGQRNGAAIVAVLSAAMPALRRHIADKIEAMRRRHEVQQGDSTVDRGIRIGYELAARAVRGDDNA